jgi:hypothetical protein
VRLKYSYTKTERSLKAGSLKMNTTLEYCTKPVFVDHLRCPGIDYQPGGPVRQLFFRNGPPSYIGLRNRISWNQFLDSINDYKYGLKSGPGGGSVYVKRVLLTI